MAGNAIETHGLKEFHREIDRLKKKMSRKELNRVQGRHLGPMLNDMRRNSPSERIAKMTAMTTRQVKRPSAPRIGHRIGVINNNSSLFPDFSAPALASVLEHGTDERFRTAAKSFSITIGTQSTGKVTPGPWLRPAWDRNVQQFIANTLRDYEKLANE